MKICLLADGHHANTVSWITHVAEHLGHEVSLLTFGRADLNIPRVRVYTIGLRLRTFVRYVLCIPKVNRLVSMLKPDLLIGYRITSYGFMAACTGYHPLVLAAQGRNIAYNGSTVKATFARFAIRRADLIHSWGAHMTDTLLRLGASPARVLTLPRGVDTELFTAPPEPHRQSRSTTIVSTRGLNPDYNFDQVLNALSLLSSSRSDFKYVICGDGPHRPQLLRQIQRRR